MIDVDTYGYCTMLDSKVNLFENDVMIGKRFDDADSRCIYRCNIGILLVRLLHANPIEQSLLSGSKGILLHGLAAILPHLVKM